MASEKTESATTLLEETIKDIKKDRTSYSKKGERLRILNSFFNVSTVILGVAAPAFVTFQTQQSGPGILMYISIFLVAIAGATATLRGVLRWGERFGYTTLTALALRELETTTQLDREDILTTVKDEFICGKIFELNRKTQHRRSEIIKRYLEREVAVVEKVESDHIKIDTHEKKTDDVEVGE